MCDTHFGFCTAVTKTHESVLLHLLCAGFRFTNERCQKYFLSHYHSDHTTGLTTGFSAGKIYCSHITAALLIKKVPQSLQPLKMPPHHVLTFHGPWGPGNVGPSGVHCKNFFFWIGETMCHDVPQMQTASRSRGPC